MSVSLFLIPLFQEELIINHSLLCPISVLYQMLFIHHFRYSLPYLLFQPQLQYSFCEDAVHLYAGTT